MQAIKSSLAGQTLVSVRLARSKAGIRTPASTAHAYFACSLRVRHVTSCVFTAGEKMDSKSLMKQ